LSFAIGYAWAATRASWLPSLCIGLSVYFLVGIALVHFAPPLPSIVVMVVGTVILAPLVFPRLTHPAGPASSSSIELWTRMIAGAALTVAVTHLSPMLGPEFSGLFAVFPIMGVVLAGSSHRANGSAFTIRLLRSMVYGFYSVTAFCLTIALALHAMGIAAGFTTALSCSLAVQIVVLWFLRRTRRRIPA